MGVEGIINGLHMFYVLRVGMSCLMSYFCMQDAVPQRASGRRRGGGPLQALLARHRARRMGKGESKSAHQHVYRVSWQNAGLV